MKQHRITRKTCVQLCLLLAGACILAFGMYNIHSRCNITEGGVLGLTLFIQRWLHISPGISGPILDFICYLLGYKYLGKSFLKNAIIASCGFSLFYSLFESIGPLLPDLRAYPLAAAIFGGLFVGIGVGIVVRQGGASGGDDALALVISKAARCNISKAYLATDITVLLLSLTYIPLEKIFFSLITVTISSLTIGAIQNYKLKTC